MFSQRSFWFLIPALVLAAAFGGPALRSSHEEDLQLAVPPPLTQSISQRSWRPEPLEEVLVTAGHPFAMPSLVTGGQNGEILVADSAERTVNRLSADGQLLEIYSLAGQDLPNLANPTDLTVDTEGRLWVSDYPNHRLLRFEPGGDSTAWQLEHAALRIAVTGGGAIFALTPDSASHVFELWKDPDAPPKPFGQVFDPALQNGLTLDGSVAADGEGGLVYAMFYTGLIAAFSADGELRYRRWAIEPVAPPRLRTATDGTLTISRDQPPAALGLSVVGRQLFVLGRLDQRGIVDIYDLDDGTYRSSFALPTPANHFHITECCLYTVGERLRIWHRQPPTRSPTLPAP